MITLIYGGSGSGKSAFAEDIVCSTDFKNRYYLATMASADEESNKRIDRHRKLREGKDFVTLEYPTDINMAAEDIQKDSIVLLECMSNLVANEMFGNGKCVPSLVCADKIIADIKALEEQASHIVIVTNNIFEDGNTYDEWTKEYMRALGKINVELAHVAEDVYEVVVGIGIKL